MPRIYLDHNATTPQAPSVTQAMEPFVQGDYGNPSSVHWFGRNARAALEDARSRVGALVGASPRGIIFTSGATEANVLALRGAVDAAGPGAAHLVLSAVEHPSVSATATWLADRGIAVTRVGVDRDGRLDPDAVRMALRPETVLVSVMLANHETGVIHPLREIGRITRAAGVPLHTDAVQAVGRIPVDVVDLGVDLLTLSGHKIAGPRGVGALWVAPEVRLEPLLHGGGQESNRRSGTENLPGAVGLGVAAEQAAGHPDESRVRRMRDRLETGLLDRWPGARVHGAVGRRLPNTTSIEFPGLDGETAVMRLDLEGIAISMGSACDTGALRPSEVLEAMGVPAPLIGASLRFSLGQANTEAEIDRVVEVFDLALVREAGSETAFRPAAAGRRR